MSGDTQASKVAAPITQEMLESLAADYKAGRLPDDVKERIDTLRDEYVENFRDRFVELQNDAKPGIDAFISDVKAQMNAYEVDGGALNSEVIDSRMLQISADVVDAGIQKVVEPVFDALEDVIHDTFDYASELVQIRAGHDPDGTYAPRLEAAQEELARSGEVFDADMERVHGEFDTVHERMEQLRDEAEQFHQDHAPVQLIRSTTVDPNLSERMAEETGEGAA